MALQGGDFSASHTMGGAGIRRYSRLVAISMAICAAMAIAAAVNLSLSGHAPRAEEASPHTSSALASCLPSTTDPCLEEFLSQSALSFPSVADDALDG